MILVSVGSSIPFDRLIRAVDEIASTASVDEPFLAQIGEGVYEPKHMKFVRFVDRTEFSTLMSRARVVISHAGVGTIAETLRQSKPMVVLPRRQRLGESVNDHQVATAHRFEQLGNVLVAYEAGDLQAKFREVNAFVPGGRTAQVDRLARRIAELIVR